MRKLYGVERKKSERTLEARKEGREREEKEVSLEETREMTCEMIREYVMCKLLSCGEPE